MLKVIQMGTKRGKMELRVALVLEVRSQPLGVVLFFHHIGSKGQVQVMTAKACTVAPEPPHCSQEIFFSDRSCCVVQFSLELRILLPRLPEG